jgi:hypothetical protein
LISPSDQKEKNCDFLMKKCFMAIRIDGDDALIEITLESFPFVIFQKTFSNVYHWT